jgi:hypothetical protein
MPFPFFFLFSFSFYFLFYFLFSSLLFFPFSLSLLIPYFFSPPFPYPYLLRSCPHSRITPSRLPPPPLLPLLHRVVVRLHCSTPPDPAPPPRIEPRTPDRPSPPRIERGDPDRPWRRPPPPSRGPSRRCQRATGSRVAPSRGSAAG